MTHLCVPIFVKDAAQMRRDAALAGEAGADMVELRIDSLTDPIDLSKLALPAIVTCRPEWEGGHSMLSDEQRIALLADASNSGARHVDVELKTLQRDPEFRRRICGSLIASAHDFKGRPDRLHNLVVEMNDLGADVQKIVWTARTLRDNLEAFEILQRRTQPTIALCMGEDGIISRILARKFGAYLTFAALDADNATASGQVSISDMKRLYRWDAIGAATKVYGVVASPVMHSMSPAIHNAAFEAIGYDGVYLPMRVNEGYESFKAFMESFMNFKGLDLSGLSVTLPHKANALRYLQERHAPIEDLALRIGAVNTIIIDRDAGGNPAPRGANTDYAAILDSITDRLKITRADLASYRVGVIGAGGTGRTAVAALADLGATIVVYNRTFERAEQLAREFNGRTGMVVPARMEKLAKSCCQIFINTTSVGMFPKIDQSPLGEAPPNFTTQSLVFDTIYNPPQTLLLKQAQAAGAMTLGGIEMFVRQAARQFELWTARAAPTEIMRAVIEKRLAGNV